MGVHISHFIPLESNPAVFSRLMYLLGAPESLLFEDVFSLNEPLLLLRLALALILVFPTTEYYKNLKASEESTREFRQTINNACGLYGILYALSNSSARDLLDPFSLITNLIKRYSHLPLSERALFLKHSAPPASAKDDVDFYYVCFVKLCKTGHLYALDGDRRGPIDTGLVLGPEEDVFAQGGLDLVR
ncbi:hypothetical protein F4808DRAFT_454268 [Astrocystis sublimbata]|nr:hypothetical protein F4808DRAFT_454268 [Astrocystis sublimbata]